MQYLLDKTSPMNINKTAIILTIASTILWLGLMSKDSLSAALQYPIFDSVIPECFHFDEKIGKDTLFLIVYDNDSVFITNLDITTWENGIYYLTTDKFMQLDSIHGYFGHYFKCFEKLPSGSWEQIRVQHSWILKRLFFEMEKQAVLK